MIVESVLPANTAFGLEPGRVGPIRAVEFELWSQEPDSPLELIEGWVLPMSPGTFKTGEATLELASILAPLVRRKSWRAAHDAGHRLPQLRETVLFPDLAIHCVDVVALVPNSEMVARVPELVIELLSPKTAARDMAPRGAKFLAYQMSGVQEYYYAWPDGSGAAAFRREGGVFVPVEPDADGFFPSQILGGSLRLVPAAWRS